MKATDPRRLAVTAAMLFLPCSLAGGVALHQIGLRGRRPGIPPPEGSSSSHQKATRTKRQASNSRSARNRLIASLDPHPSPTGKDTASLADRFQHQIWPILTSPSHNCVGCHNAGNPSSLHFTAGAHESFDMLVGKSFLDEKNPSGLLNRMTTTQSDLKMPPAPYKPLSAEEVSIFRSFLKDLHANDASNSGPPPDERFPIALLAPYHGKTFSGSPGNTFLSYYQLKGKIQSIFSDDWNRNGQDLFEKYIDLFHGADFHARFHESTIPSTEYLAGVDLLSADVASRSYLTATGPFAGWPETVPAPTTETASPLYRRLITQLFNRVLFRPPSEKEITTSYGLIRSIYRAGPSLGTRPSAIGFTVTATDPTGLSTNQNFSMPVSAEPYGLYQQYVDETKAPPDAPSIKTAADTSAKAGRRGRRRENPQIVSAALDQPIRLAKDDPGQELRIDNSDTHGNVSVAGITLEGPLPGGSTRSITVTDPGVRVEGAWEQHGDPKAAAYEDRNQNKGSSSIAFPLSVSQTGQYRISLEWRKGQPEENAPDVLVQILAHNPNHLAMKPVPDPPAPGTARFTIDETADDVAFWDLKTRFRFSHPGDGVELTNAGTHRRVVADAVRLVPDKGYPLVLTGDKAVGHDQWKVFNAGEFHPYNTTGPVLYDDGNADKGKLSLLYRPDSLEKGWKPEELYRVEVGVPGHVDNESAAPVIVHASASSPIVQVSYPLRAHVGAVVYLDATRSYNVQHTPLHFTWQQTGGPRVHLLGNPDSPRVEFIAPGLQPQQAAWEGLCAALVRSPDFLFSRPVSLAWEHDPAVRRRLQLVKITEDLLARAPTPAEIQKLNDGASLASFVDEDLDTQEFRDFYFRRIRLYLESHGSVVDDEPVRLWCYVVDHDLPFQQILTADYSVDPDMQKQPRPAYYGHSGLLTMKGFIQGKPGLPHFNYPAQVCEKFLGIVFHVPPEIVAMRTGSTASSMTNPKTTCYSCHKILTPLAFQRSAWTDKGDYAPKDKSGATVDDSDHDLVPSYPFRGKGMEAFALGAQHKEAFIRTMIQTHYDFYFGRAMRQDEDERTIYHRLWIETHRDHFSIRALIRAILTSQEYLNGEPPARPIPGTMQASDPGRRSRRTMQAAVRTPLYEPVYNSKSEPMYRPKRHLT